MRLIDADALSEELSTLTMTVIGLRAAKGVLFEFMKEYRNSVLRVVDEQPTIDPESLRPKWISVEDRLPDSMDDVLVWYEYRAYEGSGGLSKRKVKEYGIGCYIPQMGVWSKDPGIGTEARVIAWMPLPEPPKSGM